MRRASCVLLATLLALFCAAAARRARSESNPLSHLTYGGLAAATCPGFFQAAIAKLQSINETAQPGDANVKDGRGALRSLRNCLDMFAYAYPITNSSTVTKLTRPHGHKSLKKASDRFAVVRGDVNDGYETIGAFRDLTFVNATEAEIDASRTKVLTWLAKFWADDQADGFQQYVATPSNDTLYTHADLSEYFWAGAGLAPKLSMSGLQNIIYLESGLLSEAEKKYSTAYGLTNSPPLKVDDELTLHAFRKLLRAINSAASVFDIFDTSSKVQPWLDTVSTAYDNFGYEEDKISAYRFYLDNGTKQQQQDAEKALADQTEVLHEWLKANDLPTVLAGLKSHLLSI
jgi:hypothetical protein